MGADGPPQPVWATYDAANRITAWAGQPLSYDANGNLASDGPTSYAWNARNQLASLSGAASGSFAYDAHGRRRMRTTGGATSYLYDGANAAQELVGGSPTANVLTGGIDEVFQRTESAGASAVLTDALGSTVALVDGSGAVQTQYTYEPFGATATSGAASTNPAQYTGRENDSTGMYHYRARYYNPQLSRFISEDPLEFGGGDVNLVAYVGNNPISRIDPFGLDWLNNLADFSAGAGSVLSIGLTDLINDATGASSVVNKCSGWHSAGTVAGIALTTAIGGAAGAEAAEANAGEKGFEFSHWIPDRVGGPRSIFNGNYVSTAEHALNDPFRYRFMDPAWKALNPMNPAGQQQWNRIPLLLKGAGAGAAAGGASAALNGRNCGCN